jgi:hypothetical protein
MVEPEPASYLSLMGFLWSAKELEGDSLVDDAWVTSEPRPDYDDLSPPEYEEMRRLATRPHPNGGVTVCFRRFNAALERCHDIRNIDFDGSCFAGLDEDDDGGGELESLFSHVLPAHESLERIFFHGEVPTRLAKALMRGLGLASNSDKELFQLHIHAPVSSYCEDVARMIERNGRVGELFVWDDDSSLKASDCQVICDALPKNTELRRLDFISGKLEVRPTTFLGAVGAASPLKTFMCATPALRWSDGALEAVVAALRTNGTVERLCLSSGYRPANLRIDFPLFAEQFERLLMDHNFTLRTISSLDQDPRIAELLLRNAEVRSAHAALRASRYRVRSLSVWPLAMGRVSSKPALLYAFLRHGNCHDVARHVVGRRLSPPPFCASITQRKAKRARGAAAAALDPSWEESVPDSTSSGTRGEAAASGRRSTRRSARRKPSA